MNAPLWLLAWCSLIPLTMRAESPEAPVTGGYLLKKRSSFEVPRRTASPFVPIGWAKPQETSEAAVAAAPPARPVLEEKNYNLSSILLGNPALAVINGRSYSEGEFVRTPKPPGPAPKAASPGEPSSEKTGPPPKVRVARILDGLVELRSGSEVLQLPLRRQEFIPKKTDALESEER